MNQFNSEQLAAWVAQIEVYAYTDVALAHTMVKRAESLMDNKHPYTCNFYFFP